MSTDSTELNGFAVADLQGLAGAWRSDPSGAERTPSFTARWRSGEASEVEIGGTSFQVGGDDEPSSVQLVLASLATCDVATVAIQAALLGIAVEELEVQVDGHADIRRLLGVEGPPPGFDQVTSTVRLRAPGASEEQLAELQERIEKCCPVGATFKHPVTVDVRFEADGA